MIVMHVHVPGQYRTEHRPRMLYTPKYKRNKPDSVSDTQYITHNAHTPVPAKNPKELVRRPTQVWREHHTWQQVISLTQITHFKA